jgi:adenylate cyclase
MTTTTMRCRRQTVTVLFVDIVGYTTLVDDLDCADVRDLQTDYFGTVSAVIACGGGVVEKYIGDAVMAVFGADEGDAPDMAAAAAVRAGMEAQDALRGRRLAGRYPVRTRAGVATGEVILDTDAARSGGYGMVSGSVVTTAARLQPYAPDDTVVVDGGTRRLTGHLVAYQDLPPVAVAGRPGPVQMWRALHPQAALCAV